MGHNSLNFSHPSDLCPAPTWRRRESGGCSWGQALWPPGFSRETEPIGCVWHTLTAERGRMRGGGICSKELAHALRGLRVQLAGQAAGWRPGESAGCSWSPRHVEERSCLLGMLVFWMRPTHIMEGNLLYDLMLITPKKIPSRQLLDWCLPHSRCTAQPRGHIKVTVFFSQSLPLGSGPGALGHFVFLPSWVLIIVHLYPEPLLVYFFLMAMGPVTAVGAKSWHCGHISHESLLRCLHQPWEVAPLLHALHR